MMSFALRRAGQGLIVVIVVSFLTFLEAHLMPGSPARAILGVHASQAQIQAFNIENGYNHALPVQYLDYVDRLLHGNLGFSYQLNQTVAALLAERLTGVSFLLYAMPEFWLGLMLIMLLAEKVRLFPPIAPQGNAAQILSHPAGLVLPVATLALGSLASFIHYLRSSLLDNLAEDYVRTARAIGSSETRVMLRHVLRNALPPVITLVGLSLPGILGGALITESVFSYPGMGLLCWNSALSQDYPVMLGVTMIVGIATIAGSLLADLLYAAADPRVRYTRQ